MQFPLGRLMSALLTSRLVTQPTQIQPQTASVEWVEYRRGDVANPPGYQAGLSVGASADMLTAPIWGATTPGSFITISGIPPTAPTVSQVATVAGSNAPQGGKC